MARGAVVALSVGPVGGAEAREQFAALVEEYLDGLYRTALRLTRNRAAAEDLVQDALLR
ncbi:MAG: sigma factor, partial [Armatimonadota bacterium]|nr:sigma factor [Armatimonadota bacterium]